MPDSPHPAVLVFSRAVGFVHEEAIPAGAAMLQRIADDRDWRIRLTDDPAAHDPAELARYAVVVWNNCSGDVLDAVQRAALRQWIEDGGGWVGLHASGGDFSYDWDWYRDSLIGTQFVGHTMDPHLQDADVLVTDAAEPVTRHLPARWRIASEEWYAFATNPRERGFEILLTLDESSCITRGTTAWGCDRMAGEHPLAWRKSVGAGRTFYSAIGHSRGTYESPAFQSLIANALAWAMGGE